MDRATSLDFGMPALGFAPLPARYWPILGLTLVAYVALRQLVKSLARRRGWI